MNDSILDQPLPQDLDAERAVLGAILITNLAYHRVAPLLSPEDFHSERHQTLYAAMSRMSQEGREIDLLTLKDELQSNASIVRAGGSAYVSSLVDGIPDIANIERYAAIVARASKRRRIVFAANSAIRDALDQTIDPDETAATLQSKVATVAVREDRQSRALFEIVTKEHEAADARVSAGRPAAIQTGYFPQLDAMYAIRPTLIVTAGPRGHGKSAFMLNIADGIAVHGRREQSTVGIFSLEMTEHEISDRFTSMRSGVSHHDIRAWQWLSQDQRLRVDDARLSFKRERIHATRSIRTLEGIIAECRRMKAVHGLSAVVIDYIQLIKTRERVDGMEQRMAHVAAELLELAVDLGVAVIVGSQVNKDRNVRQSGRLSMEDLKYAAAIGDSARVGLLFLRPHEEDKANPDLRPCEVRMQVEKNNEGRTGDLEMHFDLSTQTFREGGCAENGCRRAAATASYTDPREFDWRD